MSKHYVARIIIEKVERPVLQKGDQYKPQMLGDRTVTELGTVTLKDNSLDELTARLVEAAHFIKDYE